MSGMHAHLAAPYLENLRRDWEHSTIGEADHVLYLLKKDRAVAIASGDTETIKRVDARAAEAERYRAAYDAAVPVLEKAEDEYRACVSQLIESDLRCGAGTLDAKAALKNQGDLAVATAVERFRRYALPSLRAAVSSPLRRITAMPTRQDTQDRNRAVDATERLAEQLFGEYASRAVNAAFDQGLEAKANIAVWWPLAEQIARGAFAERSKQARQAFKRTYGGDREMVADPKPADLDAVFAARRRGFEDAKRKARAAVAALEGGAK